MSNPLQINPVHVGVTGVEPSQWDHIFAAFLAGDKSAQQKAVLAFQKEQARIEQTKHEADQAQLARGGKQVQDFLVSLEPQTTLPAGSIPFGGASQVYITIPASH